MKGAGILLAGLMLFAHIAHAGDSVQVNEGINLNLRTAPDTASEVMGSVSAEDRLELLEEGRGFVRVRTEAGVEGWVSRGFVSIIRAVSAESAEGDDALEQLTLERDALLVQRDQLVQRVQQLEAWYASLEDENTDLRDELSSLRVELQQLREQGRDSDAGEGFTLQHYLLALAVVVLLMLLAAFRYGRIWEERRLRKRLGGLRP